MCVYPNPSLKHTNSTSTASLYHCNYIIYPNLSQEPIKTFSAICIWHEHMMYTGWSLSSHDQIPWLFPDFSGHFKSNFTEYEHSRCTTLPSKELLSCTFCVKNNMCGKWSHARTHFPWLFLFSPTTLKFPDYSRFSRWVATLCTNVSTQTLVMTSWLSQLSTAIQHTTSSCSVCTMTSYLVNAVHATWNIPAKSSEP